MNGYLDPVRAKVPQIEPVDVGLFAGALDMAKIPLVLRLVLKAMKVKPGDYRDWATELRPELLGV